ncbi:MAG: bis(5'-nucleosyl)-tetraphosphatase (symmetrical) YqeK [Gemmatimonadetes bacterium]|nr:bis(5'-nucleosyl)-tetraphosphatase (symmetrical) YqeK [Gemmatimonadota bacterium]
MRGRLSPGRWRHTLSVAETAHALAAGLGWGTAERERALLAGLLHDIAKELPEAELRGLAGTDSVGERRGMLHAAAGASLALRDYGVTDPGVLRAIAVHPTAEAHPAPLTQLLFVADVLEPLRPHLGEAERAMLQRGMRGDVPLADLFRESLRRKLAWALDRGLPLHPRSVAAWNTAGAKE